MSSSRQPSAVSIVSGARARCGLRLDAPRKVGCTVHRFLQTSRYHRMYDGASGSLLEPGGVRSEATLRSLLAQRRGPLPALPTRHSAVRSLNDVNSAIVARYIEWLNRQVWRDGTPWRTATRAQSYYGEYATTLAAALPSSAARSARLSRGASSPGSATRVLRLRTSVTCRCCARF